MPIPPEAPKRKASELAVPAKGEDPAERKRLLNVLAQRRYRQRRREHVKNLEAKAGGRRELEEWSQSPVEESLPLTEKTDIATGSETITPTLEGLTASDFNFVPEQGQMVDDPFAMFDPTFVTFPIDLEWDTNLPSIPNSPKSTTDPSNLSLTPASSHASTVYSFPDEAHLEIIELNLLRGAMAIARRLNLEDLVWSLDSTSPFTAPSMALAQFRHLPTNLRPTATQMNQPHHPIFDLLPWPTVRDKLIIVFSQPPDIRPKVAASPTALMEFVYDIEDGAEGVRIWGDDEYSDQSWEVGEKVFKNWWWAFDRDVIRRSNELRRRRGARLLGTGQGSILGEV